MVLAGCGGGGSSSICGNGITEPPFEQCDDGNRIDDDGCTRACAIPPRDIFVRWRLLPEVVPGFNEETCGGLDAEEIELTFTGASTFTERFDCSFAQTKFENLPRGSTTVRGQLLDDLGEPISGAISMTFTVGDELQQEVVLAFPFETFTRAYTGSFFFKVSWAGSTACPVARQVLELARDGTPLTGVTTNGDKLDGTPSAGCYPASDARAQAAAGLPGGPARFTITGVDDQGTALYRESFDTFVGAGLSNPVLEFDVTSLQPDAGPPDAAVPDAALVVDASTVD
jgi:cysteine-rich repeat protein